MNRLVRFAISILLILTAASSVATFAFSTSTIQERLSSSWLDRPLANWNANSSELPVPLVAVNKADIRFRCPDLVREPDRPSERELARAGWLLYGSAQSYGLARVITALSGVDGMCRPLGYQVFVFWDGRYAGTLSPAPMDSRTNGALTHYHLVSASRISAEIARYKDADAACCPSRISYVSYEITGDTAGLVGPVEITTLPVTTTEERESVSTSFDEAQLFFETKWKLIELRGARVEDNSPYIRFERETKTFTGNGGCNAIAGRFAVEGKQLKISLGLTTRMACLDPAAQKVETDFLESLGNVTNFQVEREILSLHDWTSPILVFQSESAAAASAAQEPLVTGTVTYSKPIELSDNAVLEIQLVDTSRVNGPETIAEDVIKIGGKKFPIAFELTYEPGRIEEDHRYVVQARVMDNSRRRLVSVRPYRVITKGNPKKVDIALVSVRR
jgi:uncharacterized lipoprotein YbaY